MSAVTGNGDGPASDAPFVAGLRNRSGIQRLGAPGEPVVTIRVQFADAWDSLRFEVPVTEPVIALKARALELLAPDADFHEDYVLKLHGFEVLDEHLSVAATGARDGSIYLLAHRRRRPVR